MNIGIVTTWFERGAAYVSKQFEDVLSKENSVFIYARGGEKYAKGDPKWDRENVTWGKRDLTRMAMIGSTYINKKDFIKWIKQNSIEVILFNEQQWFTPIIWCKELGVKTFAYIDYYTEATIPLFDIYDGLICNTKRHAFAFRNHRNVKYIKWGTDIDLYKPSNICSDKLTFFHSAGMAPFRKGTDILLESFYKTKNRRDARLLLHTQVSITDTFPHLSEIIKEMVDENTLKIVRKTVSAPGLYSQGDVYVYPSRLDGIGLTLMEAISSGLACITIDSPPMNEFIEDDFGRLCDVEYLYSRRDGYYWPMSVANKDSLTHILDNFIDKEIDINSMKLKAREYAIKELDFVKNCEKLNQIIYDTELQSLSTIHKDKIYSFNTEGHKKILKYFYPLYWLRTRLNSFKSIIDI